MRDQDDTPLSDEERARRGERLIETAAADTRAPQSLREAIERERVRRAPRPAPFWRAHRRKYAAGIGGPLGSGRGHRHTGLELEARHGGNR